MLKITAIIPTFNEQDHILQAIESVSWADEIIVVDSYSTDKTVELALEKKVKIIKREYQYSASQKNWAIPQAANDWIFLLDADERLSISLKDEILKWKTSTPKYNAYWIRRINHFMGKKIKYSGWQGDKVVRLFKKDCRYEDKKVHSEISYNGEIGSLSNPLLHFTFKNTAHYLKKWDQYSTWSAKDHFEKGENPGLFHFLVKPAFRFFRDFFLRGGFLDGKTGFIVCKLSSMGVFLRYVKLKELQNSYLTK